MGRALPDLVAARLKHGRNAVSHPTEAVHARRLLGVLARATHVAVAAGLRDGMAGEEQAWPDEVAFLDRPRQAPVGSAHVAHRRESSEQHVPEDVARSGGDVHRRPAAQEREVGDHRSHVDVAVAETGHDDAPAHVDDPPLGRPGRLRGNVGDAAALHYDVNVGQKPAGRGIEHHRVAEHEVRHGSHLSGQTGQPVVTVFMCGSRRSRRASPTRLTPSTVVKIASPGNIASHDDVKT
jgi:hypothetical protein